MMMIVDISNMTGQYGDMVDALERLGGEIGVAVKCQKEEIFDQMHRI